MDELNQAIAYFEDAIRESDEIISECSPALQKRVGRAETAFCGGTGSYAPPHPGKQAADGGAAAADGRGAGVFSTMRLGHYWF